MGAFGAYLMQHTFDEAMQTIDLIVDGEPGASGDRALKERLRGLDEDQRQAAATSHVKPSSPLSMDCCTVCRTTRNAVGRPLTIAMIRASTPQRPASKAAPRRLSRRCRNSSVAAGPRRRTSKTGPSGRARRDARFQWCQSWSRSTLGKRCLSTKPRAPPSRTRSGRMPRSSVEVSSTRRSGCASIRVRATSNPLSPWSRTSSRTASGAKRAAASSAVRSHGASARRRVPARAVMRGRRRGSPAGHRRSGHANRHPVTGRRRAELKRRRGVTGHRSHDRDDQRRMHHPIGMTIPGRGPAHLGIRRANAPKSMCLDSQMQHCGSTLRTDQCRHVRKRFAYRGRALDPWKVRAAIDRPAKDVATREAWIVPEVLGDDPVLAAADDQRREAFREPRAHVGVVEVLVRPPHRPVRCMASGPEARRRFGRFRA